MVARLCLRNPTSNNIIWILFFTRNYCRMLADRHVQTLIQDLNLKRVHWTSWGYVFTPFIIKGFSITAHSSDTFIFFWRNLLLLKSDYYYWCQIRVLALFQSYIVENTLITLHPYELYYNFSWPHTAMFLDYKRFECINTMIVVRYYIACPCLPIFSTLLDWNAFVTWHLIYHYTSYDCLQQRTSVETESRFLPRQLRYRLEKL